MNIRNSQWDYIIVQVYADNLLIISNKALEDHIEKLCKVLIKLKSAGFKVNAGKSFLDRYALEYLGFKITREGIVAIAVIGQDDEPIAFNSRKLNSAKNIYQAHITVHSRNSKRIQKYFIRTTN